MSSLSLLQLIERVITLLGVWRNHAEYQRFMIEQVNRKFKHNPQSIDYYETAILKMYSMNLNSLREDFKPLFSPVGRPSNQQPEVFRSFVLMSHFKYAGLEEWLTYAKSSYTVCALVGVTPDTFPGESTHRDFVTRLWQLDDTDHMKSVAKKPRTKHGKEKLPPKNPGIIKKLADKAMSGEVFKRIPERLLQAIFTKVALIPSAAMGLLGDTNKLIISGDGTCVTSNASHYGKKVCNCEGSCSCLRKFSDPSAKWGWDSYHERWFYGYTAYLLSVHNPKLKLDLPIYMKFVEAARFDGVTAITALAHARHLYKDLLTFDSFLGDSAHDNYATYDLLKHWSIKPFIDLNKRQSEEVKLQNIPTTKDGVPVCPDGHLMLNWGFDSVRYRIKYRCPMATGKVKSCPFSRNCNKTLYGKIVYIRLAENLRILTPIPRNSDEWDDTYNQRTAAERINNRILTDYELEHSKRYGKKKLAFFAFINAINVHLDAQAGSGSSSLYGLVV
jgi:hypothetical protein